MTIGVSDVYQMFSRVSGFTFESSFVWLDESENDIKQFGYIETPRRQYTAPHVTQRMQEPFRGNKFRLGGQKT